ncbi:hypothetical protein [Streptomyces goshikiensis]
MMDGMYTVTLLFPDGHLDATITLTTVPRVGEGINWQGLTDWRVRDVTWGFSASGLQTATLELEEEH